MGDRNLETLSRDPDLARQIAARTNLLQVYGYGEQNKFLFERGKSIQREIVDTGTCPKVAYILEPLGQLVTNLPGSLTVEEQDDLKLRACMLESIVGGPCLLPVVLTWVMREAVREGKVSLELVRQRPAEPVSMAQALRRMADSMKGVTTPRATKNNILQFRRKAQPRRLTD